MEPIDEFMEDLNDKFSDVNSGMRDLYVMGAIAAMRIAMSMDSLPDAEIFVGKLSEKLTTSFLENHEGVQC